MEEKRIKIVLRVNRNVYQVEAEPRQTLLEVLREDLHLTGTKEGCGFGDCGTCTVLMDNQPVLSCITLAVESVGKEITTIEGLVQDGKMDPLQESFVNHGAIQCGFCTPGMIMTAKALLISNANPTELEIKKAIAGNLCRCTGYVKIIEAIKKVSSGPNLTD